MGEVIEVRSFKENKKYRYLIRNISSLEIQLISQVSTTPLPLMGDANNVLTKAEGNTIRITVGWVLHDDDSDVVLPNNYNTAGTTVGGGTTPVGFGSDTTLKLADNQVKFLLNNQAEGSNPSNSGFQTTYLDDVYQIVIGNIGFSRVGLIESLQVSKAGDTPVTWKATMAFIAGDVVTA